MTKTIMTRPAARTTETTVAANPEYACSRCGNWHTGPCPAAAHAVSADLALRMARQADARIPHTQRARRTLQEMAPGHERQPVLVLHRPVMADGPCPLCERWTCNPANCPPSNMAPSANAGSSAARTAVTA